MALDYVKELTADELGLLDSHMQRTVCEMWQSYAQQHWHRYHDDFDDYEDDEPYEAPPQWRFWIRTLAELHK